MVGKYHQRDPYKHRQRDIHNRFYFPLDPEPPDKHVQDIGKQNDLQRQRQQGRYVEMMLAGDETYYGSAYGEKKPLPGEEVNKPGHPPLYQHAESCQQYQRRKKTYYL